MTTSFYYSEANLGLVIAEKSTQQAWTGIQEIDENSQTFIPGQKLGQVDNLACSGIASLQNLAIPTTENIFQNLRVRYYRDQIYTECGEQVLLILNPHKPLNIYDELLIQYKLSKQNDKQPHIYKITEQAKAAIFNQPQKGATILLTGQSGAGKTVSTKHVLKYIAKESKSGTFQSVLGVDVIPIDVQITQTNILFEALGNASTAKNNNSSRFGKLVQIQFNNQKLITSGRIQIHLFEKIRLTKLNYQDRNFHIFYELLAGYQNRNLLSDVEKNLKFESQSCVDFQELANRLGELQLDYDFLLLGNSKPTENDLQNFLLLCDSLELLKFKEEEIYEIFELLAGLLHLGGVQNPPETYNLFTCAEKLLQIPNLEEQFRKEEMKSVAVGKSLESASAVHGFIVHVYSQLFEWIVNRVNGQLSTGFVQENQNILNVFDGFGFETIENEQGVQQNHLEQMILNYTCEKLQSYFFDSIIVAPYINEGIKWKKIQLDLNDTLVKLFDEVIFTSLSDCTQIGGVTDQHFLDTIKKACPLKPKHEQHNVPQFSDLLIRDCHTNLQQSKKILSQSQTDRKILGIKHSNGEVYYNMNQFLQRNKYAISEQRQSITKQSSNTVVKGFQVVKYTTTLVKNAQLALKQLLQLFQQTVPFFVKCILPNNAQKSRTFDGPSVLKQLIESGVQQTAQLLTELYHFKVPIPEFFKNYSLIFKKVKVNGAVQIDLAKQFLQGSSEYQHIFLVDPPLLQFGENIVFMQKAVKALLDSHQQKLLANFIAWGIKQFRTRIINKKKKKIQEPQFGVIPQENQVQEEEPQQVVDQPPSYEELLNKLQETEAQLSIFQRLYQQEIQKNQNQQESLALAMLDKINGKIEILLQRSEPQQEFVSTIY